MRKPQQKSILLLPLLLGGCQGPMSTLDPAGPAATAIAGLWWLMLWGAVVIFVLVMALLWLALRKPALGRRVTTRHWLLYGGLALPTAVLILLLIQALHAGERLLAKPDAPAVLQIHAQASAWQWRFRYPDIADTWIDVLHLPTGQAVDILITSTDVVHSFWVPRLAGKMDAIPGHENRLRIQVDRPGLYQGLNAEFNGAGHAHMRFHVVAHAADTYDDALREALP